MANVFVKPGDCTLGSLLVGDLFTIRRDGSDVVHMRLQCSNRFKKVPHVSLRNGDVYDSESSMPVVRLHKSTLVDLRNVS